MTVTKQKVSKEYIHLIITVMEFHRKVLMTVLYKKNLPITYM